MIKRLATIGVLFYALAAAAQTKQPLLQPHQTFVDGSGAPCAGCYLYSYAAGTTTPLVTYADSSGGTSNQNPIQLDPAGGAQIWLGTSAYKFILKDTSGTPIWTVDNVSMGSSFCSTQSGCTFGGALTDTAGFIGPTTGTHTGNVTGNVTAPIINTVQYPTTFATLQSNVTACASATCTIVLNSSITITADLSIPSNVTVQFNNGAVLTYGAHALTLSGPIQAPPVQIFSGTGTLSLGATNSTVPGRWFGAVGDSNTIGTTGTDSTAAIQSCLNAIYSGQCFLSAGNYRITSALSISRNEVGLRGVDNGWVTSSIAPVATNPTRIVLHSATGDILDVAGTDATHNIVANRIEYITLTRGLTPSTSGVNANLALKYSYGAIIRNVTVEDAQYGFYFIGVGAGLNGYIENCAAYWGYNGFVETAGNLFGYYIDSSTGVNSPSLRIRNSGAGSNIPMANVGVTTYGMRSQGTQPHDLHVTHFESALVNYGIVIDDTAPGGSSAADIYLENSINDGCYSTCVLVIGATSGTVNITNGWEAMELGTPSQPVVDIQTSSHVTVSNEHLFCPTCTAPLLSINGGGSNIVTGVDLLSGANGAISVVASSQNVISGNTASGPNAWGTNVFSITSASISNVIANNTISGTATNGILIDATSTGQSGIETNNILATGITGTITNKISDPSNNGATQMLNAVIVSQAAGSGNNILQIDTLGNVTNSGVACCGGGSGNATSLQTIPIDPTAPTSGQLLAFNGTNWIPTTTGGSAAFSSITAGTNNAALVMGAGGSLTVSGGGTVQATSLSGNILESQVTNLTTDLAAKVPTSRTVNGHGLSANVVVSASDLTTGTLPHAQLPPLVSGDIPNNAAATSSTSAGLTGNPSIAVTNLTISGTCTGCPGSGSLPTATDNLDKLVVDNAGVAALLTPGDDVYNVVVNGGIDNTGVTDVSAAIATIITTESALTYPPTLYFPAGVYKVNSGILLSCTSTTCSGISILGAGSDSTIFQSDCSGHSYVLWYNNTTNSGDNFKGMAIANLQLQDTSGTGACADGLRLTQTSLNSIRNVKRVGFQGKTYSTGTVAISGATVTGTGTTFTSAMVPGVIQVAGVMAEACTFNSSTSLTLCDTAWPTGTVGAGASYAIAYNGRSLTFDAGFSFTQYISVWDSFGYGNMFDVYSIGTTGGGNSRISIQGRAGWSAPTGGTRIANSVGYWLGKHSDTFIIDTPTNFHTRCWVLDSAHANKIGGECEDNSTYAIVTTCNGGVAAQSCNFGAEISADAATSSGYGNSFISPNIYLTGTAFKVDNSNGAYNLSISALRAASFSNTNSYNFAGTLGCPVNGSGVAATITDFDCFYSPLVGVANVTITTTTTSVPAGDCLPAKAGAGTSKTMTGLVSTATLTATANGDVVNNNGFGPGGALYLDLVPGSGAFTWRLCNSNLAGAVVPGSGVTWNVSAAQ